VSPPRAAAALALVAALAPAARAAAQDDLTDYTVRPGDTCRGIAARLYGDEEDYRQIHRHNPGLGPTPHELTPGSTLRVPRPEPPARLRSVFRRVERRPPRATGFSAARRGHPLPRGTQVRTHDEASATIEFRDSEQVQIRERTLVIVWGGQRRLTQRPVTRAELESGALRARLPQLAGRRPLEVQTPSATASLDGDGVVTVEEDGTSQIANHGRRAATVEAGGARVRLGPGQGTVVRRGERPSRPRRLLPAPRWRADRSGPVIGFVGRGATLSGGFEAVEGAERYRVEIARQPDGSELLTTLELGGRASRFEAPGLPEGTVYVSVASVDAAGLEGRRSPWRAFGVRLARLVEPGGARAVADEVVPRVWPGTWLVAPRGMECADEDGAPTGIVTLSRPGRHALACRTPPGAEPAPLEVEVFEVAVRTDAGGLERDRATPVALEVTAPRVPPPRVLVVDAGDGFRVSGARVVDDRVVVDVWAAHDAPDEATLEISVAAGAERIALGTLRLPVNDPTGADRLPPPEPDALPDRLGPRPAQAVWGDVAWPSLLGLRDERRRGFGAWTSLTVAEAGPEPQVRLGVGARAQLPDTPLRLGFGSQLDLLARPAPPGRRGDADIVGSVGALMLDEDALGLAIDATGWFGTRGEPESLGRVRLAPSLEGSWRPVPELSLRTRQGAVLDARPEDAARLWAWAVGFDLAPTPWLAIGVELDAAIGRFADREGAALTLGGGIEGRWGLFEAALGARFGLTHEARALGGDWAATLSLRLTAR